jgi:5-methylcytosine-specific restriction protein A
MPVKPPSKKREVKQYSQGKVGAFYSSIRWIKVRDLKRRLNPICEECERNGKITPYHTIDHIIPIIEGGEWLDLDNLQTLCDTCHRKKTAKEVHKRNR